ncbi:unnamed protein product [Effrenium voratum]|nr:unnamed protein product [Effrenium voratum]
MRAASGTLGQAPSRGGEFSQLLCRVRVCEKASSWVAVHENENRVEVGVSNGHSDSLRFDRIFRNDNQEELFSHLQPALLACVGGASCTVVAHGGPQSGKSYALSGLFTSGETHGIAPRTIHCITEEMERMAGPAPTAGVFLLFGWELASAYPWYAQEPIATQDQIALWQAEGKWSPRQDPNAGISGFHGFAVLFPFYVDLTFSHSVEGMALASLVVVLLGRSYGMSWPTAAAVCFCGISHPVMDMFFHDAYFLMGNRAKTRVSAEFWHIPYIGPAAFLLELLMCYLGFHFWWSSRSPKSKDAQGEAEIARYLRMFWGISLSHNMASFYIMSPVMCWAFYRFAPELQFLTPASYWSFCLFAVVMWSWALALYPLHKLEQLTVRKDSEVEDQYLKIV